jgi:hypothetical protein
VKTLSSSPATTKKSNITPSKVKNSTIMYSTDSELSEISGKEFKRMILKMANLFKEGTYKT